MARLPYVDPQEAPARVADALDRAPPLNIFRLIAHAETALRPWLAFGAALLSDLELNPVLRELVILRVAALTPGAEYEWIQHEAIGRAIGLSDAQVEGARSGEGLEGDDALVARFTEEVVRDAAPCEQTFAEINERFSPREIIELLLVIGQYMLVARVMATAQIDLEPAADPADLAGMLRAKRPGA